MTRATQRVVWNGVNWYLEAISRAEPGPSEVSITTEALLIPGRGWDMAFWVGHPQEEATVRYGGWGPLLSHRVCPREAVRELPADVSAPEACLLMLMAGIRAALEHVVLSGNVMVLGQSLLAALTRAYLAQVEGVIVAEEEQKAVDLLIDTSGQSSIWSTALSHLVNEGTALLLVPPGPQSVDVNFYPDVHGRSLTLVARYWHQVSHIPLDLSPWVHEHLQSMQQQKMLHTMVLTQPSSQEDAWQLLQWHQVPGHP